MNGKTQIKIKIKKWVEENKLEIKPKKNGKEKETREIK